MLSVKLSAAVSSTEADPAAPALRMRCAICGRGAFSDAVECAEVPSNVRAFCTEHFPVWRCACCLSLHSLHVVELDRYYARYPFANRRLDFWTRLVFGNLLRRYKRAGLTRASRILDYGCGEGLLVSFLKEQGYRNCFGFDPYSVCYRDPAALAEKYDFIVAQDVLEHVEHPRELLAAWRERLNPGGKVCVGTPNAELLNLSRLESCIHSLHQPYHLHVCSMQGLKGLAERAGFEIQDVYTLHACDTWLPTINWTFIVHYIGSQGNTLDAAFEPPRMGAIAASPKLWFYAFFGRLFPTRSEMMLVLSTPR